MQTLPCMREGIPSSPKLKSAALAGIGFALLSACSGPRAASSVERGAPSEREPATAMQAQEIGPGDEVLVVGATGSVGQLVVAEALQAGYRVRALVRDRARAEESLPPRTVMVVGDLTEPASLPAAVEGVDGIVFTHGASGETAAREVNSDEPESFREDLRRIRR